jgi:bifunctional non-homologous end joining protein LigD
MASDLPIQPMLASALPEGKDVTDFHRDEWCLERKYDGHRVIIELAQREVRAWARSGKARQLPPHIIASLNGESGVYDGELYVPDGTSTDVTALHLQSRLRLVLFDTMGAYVTLPGYERRKILQASTRCGGSVALSEQYEPSVEALHAIWAAGGEGAILKHLASPYQPGRRSKSWVKLKRHEAAELTIVGWQPGTTGAHCVALLQDDEGIETGVKILNDSLRAQVELDPGSFIGRRLVIMFQERTRAGQYRHGVWDHLL